MSIDKFGRVLKNGEVVALPFAYDKVLSLNSSGNFNALQKRIEDLSKPIRPTDAANSEYVSYKIKAISLSLSSKLDYYNANKKNIKNVKDPVDNQDAVTKQYLHSTDLVSEKLQNCLQFTAKEDYFNAKSKNIRNVKDPIEAEDVVTLKYLNSRIPIRLENAFSLGNEKLQDVAYPTEPGDAVNVQYVINNCLGLKDEQFDGRSKAIKHILAGVEESDAATLSNIHKAIKEYDVLIRKALKSLGAALFPYVQKGSRSSVTKDNYLQWNKIYP